MLLASGLELAVAGYLVSGVPARNKRLTTLAGRFVEGFSDWGRPVREWEHLPPSGAANPVVVPAPGA